MVKAICSVYGEMCGNSDEAQRKVCSISSYQIFNNISLLYRFCWAGGGGNH
jgi:hypothetical protein